jgi:XTP/dITP diphosphohydrolase
MRRRLVLASDNLGKLREFGALLAPLDLEVVAQRALGVTPADEPHATFVENALAKARHASAQTGLPALADDSGLCCRALGGAPGVRSARFAAPSAGGSADAANNAELMRRLAGHDDRAGHYVCALVALRSADDPEPLIAVARWPGIIALAPRGANGFGYDPYFFLPDLGQTAAELAPAHKNRVSHRGKAMALIARELAQAWSE